MPNPSHSFTRVSPPSSESSLHHGACELLYTPVLILSVTRRAKHGWAPISHASPTQG